MRAFFKRNLNSKTPGALLVISLLAVLPNIVQGQGADDYISQQQLARQLVGKGKFEEASQILRNLLKSEPDDVENLETIAYCMTARASITGDAAEAKNLRDAARTYAQMA